jgi:transcriptional regulator with XRE-family HTH domain
MAIADDPAVARRILRRTVRAAREGAGQTREDAAAALDWSLSKLVRIETGDQGVSVTDLRAMLQLYKVTDEDEARELERLARNSRGSAWWGNYRDVVTKQYGQMLSYEGHASTVRSFQPLLFPGLLHTDEYGFELRRVRMPDMRARKLVDLLTERQERLFESTDPPELVFVFGEEALYRMVGGPTVMRRQLRHLLDIRARRAISIRVVRYSAGAHVGLGGSFTLLGLRDLGEDLLFVEGASGDIVNRDDDEMIASFSENFETLRSQALPENETAGLISQRIDEIASQEHGNGS